MHIRIPRVSFWMVLAAAPFVLGICMLLGQSPMTPGILQLRAARVATACTVGAALACAGVVLQALLRNPLAEPYVLGVSSGAALGAVLAIWTRLAERSAAALPTCAFAFSVVTLLVVYGLASRHGPPSVYGLILSGVVVSAMCSSVLMFLIANAPSFMRLHTVTWWMLGSLGDASAGLLVVCAATTAAGCAAAWLLARDLNALTLGREVAHSVGVRTTLTVAAGLCVATVLTATAVSLAGLIGFVGLIVPHAVRGMTGADHRRLIPAAALAGALFLALCDAGARTVLPGREVPVGVLTALLGGPFFLFVLQNRKRGGWTE